MKVYCQMESLLLSTCRGEEFNDLLTDVCNIYDDFDKSRLELHLCKLCMLPTFAARSSLTSLSHADSGQTHFTSVTTFANFFRQKSPEVRSLFGDVECLLRLLLVVPAASAIAERSFSYLRRLKTYLRSTVSQPRLNHMAILHVHQDKVESLDLNAIQHEFVGKNDSRRKLFGNLCYNSK
jgi:hypothetical protein